MEYEAWSFMDYRTGELGWVWLYDQVVAVNYMLPVVRAGE